MMAQGKHISDSLRNSVIICILPPPPISIFSLNLSRIDEGYRPEFSQVYRVYKSRKSFISGNRTLYKVASKSLFSNFKTPIYT